MTNKSATEECKRGHSATLKNPWLWV